MSKAKINPLKVKMAAIILHAINHKERIALLVLLTEAGEMRPREIEEVLNMTANIVIFHLNILQRQGFVTKRKELHKKEVYYSVNPDRISQVITGVKILTIARPKDYIRVIWRA